MTDSTLNNQLNEEESFDFSEITNYDKIKYQPANVFNNGTQKNSNFDIDLSDWIKKNAISEYRSFSSFLNKLMLDHKEKVQQNSKMNVLKSESKI